jgi:hypothetical protein
MQFLAKFLLILAMCVVTLRAEHAVAGSAMVRDTPAAATKAKRKHFRWLRRICSGEVDLAIKLSSIGIPKTAER